MGVKGDRASKEPLAIRLYAEGKGLAEIGRQLDVSVVTLSRWKSESLAPGESIDGWEKARQQKRANIQRLKDLFERELDFVESQPQGSLSAASMDALSKLGSLIQKWEAVERPDVYAMTPIVMDKFVDYVKRTVKDSTEQEAIFGAVDRFFDEVNG